MSTNLDDFLDKFNWISRLQGKLWGLTSWLPHRRSHKGRKTGSYVVDGGTREIHVDRMTNTGGEAERVLADAHIPISGKRITSTEAIFLVRSRQAEWAELILLRAGIKLGQTHQMINQSNARYAAGKGSIPLWGKAPEQPAPDRRQPKQAKPKTSKQTVSRARRALWRIADEL